MTPQVEFLRSIEETSKVVIGDAILLELLQGVSSERQARRLEAALKEFPIYTMLGTRIAIAAADNYRLLRRKGITIRKTMDIIIGTFCIEEGHALLHQDRDFNPMRDHLGLQVVQTSGVGE
ncbi:hypothetical protein EV561_101249 [Rhizobium sp. BK376]|nr:hypothetical protein EV561_101249 [Rhizobium sp. BK376]